MIKIMLDKEREVKLDLNAMVRFEQVTGRNALEGLENLTVSELRALLWACLYDDGLTVEDVGALITADNIADISKALSGALGNPTQARSG